MDVLAYPVLAYYLAAIGVLCVYGVHRYWLVILYLRHRRRAAPAPPPDVPEPELPTVTVQLPMFNEPLVAERIIRAACALDYPADRLQIQVLDDSTDETTTIASRVCRELAAAGHDVAYIHRTCREGYKAGALAEGLETARGELVAVFDADFLPPARFLRQTVPHLAAEQVGMVQARWAHLNRDHSLLTEIQAMSLDAHFIIEQAARAMSGRWFNFNGTAGVWRRTCIDDAGGWQHDTLTEDTDLSYRAQLAGWRFLFLPDVLCPAEIPPNIGALMGQQHRWTKGLIQTGIKLLPRILASRAPWKVKLEAWFHLTAPAPYLFILLLALLALPGIFMPLPLSGLAAPLALALGLACLALGTMAACVFYIVSQQVQRRPFWKTVLRLLALMAVGVGISVINTRAVLEAIFGRQSPFVRTPKYAGGTKSAADPAGPRRRVRGLGELSLGLLMVLGVVLAFMNPFTLIGVPFLLLFAAGFLAVGVPLLVESIRGAGPRPAPVPAPSAAVADH